MDQRLEQLKQWVGGQLNGVEFSILPASADASFRRYFRVGYSDGGVEQTSVVMDAPPEKEDSTTFIAIAETLRGCGVNAPEVLAVDLEAGFMLLSDLGSIPYLEQLTTKAADTLYGDAMDTLLTMQQKWPTDHQLPPYDRALLMEEMGLFREWYLGVHRQYSLHEEQDRELEQQFSLLADSALEQPRVAVHRDYHSRNLMVLPIDNPGVIDFQDAVWGPITYDLVSLLRDCYVSWDGAQVEEWALLYFQRLVEQKMVDGVNLEQFMRWFDWMGVQRHLKAIGIFSRLNHRDGKPGYLGDIPRTLNYVAEVTARYKELEPLYKLVRHLL